MQELSFYDIDGERLILDKSLGSAQSTYSSQFSAEMAFDEISDEGDRYYCSQNRVTTGWLKYDFQSPVGISKYAIERLNGHSNQFSPVSWTLEGSVDDSSWIVLDEQSGHDSWNDGEIKEFEIRHSSKSNQKRKLNLGCGRILYAHIVKLFL